MNLKLLITTYRNRFRFIQDNLIKYSQENKFEHTLNLGSGEGDYDSMIAAHSNKMIGCDINEQDVAFAKTLNREVPNLDYQIENALELTFADESFDLITSMEVIEHVGQPKKMMEEVARVIKKDGLLFMTFPSLTFPFTYDPINRFLSYFGNKKISQGAYAFGHDYLIDPVVFKQWIDELGFEIIEERNMGGYLIGLLEVYWTGWVQSIFKANAANVNVKDEQKITLRPSTKPPLMVVITDAFLNGCVSTCLYGLREICC